MTPVPGAPALVIGAEGGSRSRLLVVADVHLGLGGRRERPEGPPEASASGMAESIAGLARATRSSTVLVAGDVKHPIVGTPPPLRPPLFGFFARLLEDGLTVEVILGNHDVGLVRYLPREVVVHPASGVVRHEVGLFHGHRWPSAEVLRAPRLVVGHLHPGYRLAATPEDPEGKRRCWVRVERHGDRPPGGSRDHQHRVLAREIVVLPAFNPIAGTEALNRNRPTRGRSFLYRRFLSTGASRAYLLDGTDLGPLPNLERADRPLEEPPRATRGP